jgi:hypothetical protein
MQFSEAEQRLRQKGLLVRVPRPDSLFLATRVVEHGNDRIQVYQDASTLIGKGDGQYVAIFPSAGHAMVDVPGTLDELIPLVEKVYQHHEYSNQPLCESVRQIILGMVDWSQGSGTLKIGTGLAQAAAPVK